MPSKHVLRWVLVPPSGVICDFWGRAPYVEFLPGREREIIAWLRDVADIYEDNLINEEMQRDSLGKKVGT